jgi:hypothetical protein
VEKGERAGWYGQNALLLPPLPPDLEQRRSGWPSAGGGRRHPGGRRRPGKREKRRGNRGDLDPLLTLDRNRLWRRLCGVGRRPTMVVGGGGAWRLGRQGGSAGAVRGEVGSRAGPLIGAGRSVRGKEKSSRRPSEEGPRRGRLREKPDVDLGRLRAV